MNGIPQPTILDLFPFSIVLENDGTVVDVGRALKRICSGISPGVSLLQHAVLDRSFDSIKENVILNGTSGLIFCDFVGTSVSFRSELKALSGGRWILVCHPWIDSFAKLNELGLSFNDFSPADPVIDLVQIVELQRQSSADLKTLSQQLAQQRDELSKKEAELKMLALVARRTDSAVVITSAEGKIEWVNEGFEKMTGFTLEEIARKKPGEFLQGLESDADCIVRMRNSILKGEPFKEELINYRKDREKYWVRIEANPILGRNNRVEKFIAIQSDISAVKATQQKLEKALQMEKDSVRFRDRLISMASHEFRTPLSAIKLMAELLLRIGVGDQDMLQSKLKAIVNQVNLLGGIVTDILGVNELSEHNPDGSPRETVVAYNYLQQVVNDYRDICFGCRLVLRQSIPDRDSCRINIISSNITRVIFNLLDNAFKYSKAGSTVDVKSEQNGPEFVIMITDSGIGIPKNELPQILHPFTRASNADHIPGTGLGLYIAAQAMSRHGGNISIESKEGEGTKIALHFPIVNPANQPNAT